MAVPQLTPFSAWALRHEYHLQYLTLTLAQRMVGIRQPRLTPIPLFTPSLPLSPIISILLLWNLCCFWQDMQFLLSSRCAPQHISSLLKSSSLLLFSLSPLKPLAPAFCPQATLQLVPATNAALHHSMALALLSRLLPGSEHLAHELLLSCVFRLEFLP